MKVAMIGTGYVGLVTGVCLAEKGHDVICVDLDLKKVDAINQGIAPISERGLEPLLKRNIGTPPARQHRPRVGDPRGGAVAHRGGHPVRRARDRPDVCPERGQGDRRRPRDATPTTWWS